MPHSAVSAQRATQGGLVGQYSAFGSWELDEDEALILTTHPSDADYQGVELGNLWFVSLEYETRTSSLTRHQAYQSEDGLYRFVVSGQDPGIQNWLDSEGHSRGLIMLRWQGLSEAQDASRQPSARVVPIGRVRQDLPPDTPEFGPAKRAQQIRGRRREAQQRFPG